mmetsp:Transcript_8957/g.23431  ORF Transcript_8957/g.23431 Transcript_8957/m.23431 type:complete len:208 (-) Transcript_8957:377-1000(-)|eukprot:CAMPEP_0115868742 /NCGR_PEP_ID=MMETSP0287-20121206/21450_1 /TAXON_ID=412157 /ORGANISM="Chrysochromulina rotalis, Strain UIO044" /LENGTH=207 /DNA_ID=CAMNT_0003323407 /DNA_START=54 /DNA_END=680 /DNA_ORIENTATION=-
MSASQVADMLKAKLEQRCTSLQAAFRKLDKSNTGFISPADFEDCLRDFNMRLTRQALAALVAKYDANGDGYVSYQEFAAVMSGSSPSIALHSAAAVAAPAGVVERAEEAFKRIMYAEATSLTDAFLKLDRDRSGKISAEELAAVFTASNVQLSAQELKMIMNKYDVDGDGQISLNELAMLLPTGGPLGAGRIERGQLVSKKRVRVNM